jgi:hypothetical protein
MRCSGWSSNGRIHVLYQLYHHLLIYHWTTPVRPSKSSVATWDPSQLDKHLHHAGKQPHPGRTRRVNMGIAKSHKEVAQVEVPNSHSCQDTPPHPSVPCRSAGKTKSGDRLLEWLSTSRHIRCRRAVSYVVAVCMDFPFAGVANSFDNHSSIYRGATQTLRRGVGQRNK